MAESKVSSFCRRRQQHSSLPRLSCKTLFYTFHCEKTVLKITVNSRLEVIVNIYRSSQRVSAVLAIFKYYKNVQHTWGLMTTLSSVKRNMISYLHKGYISTRIHVSYVILIHYALYVLLKCTWI
jgi:hypothetical protein